jgi:hypothetical protein
VGFFDVGWRLDGVNDGDSTLSDFFELAVMILSALRSILDQRWPLSCKIRAPSTQAQSFPRPIVFEQARHIAVHVIPRA